MYQCQLNFALFAVTSPLGFSWQHLNHPNLLVRAVYRFHVYFHIRLKIPTLRVHITVSVITMALMQMKHGCMGIGYIQRIMVFSVMK